MNTQDSRVTDEDVRKLVVARLHSFPAGRKISIGADGEFTKDELIERVEKDDRVGKKIVEIQLSYLQSLKEQRFMEE